MRKEEVDEGEVVGEGGVVEEEEVVVMEEEGKGEMEATEQRMEEFEVTEREVEKRAEVAKGGVEHPDLERVV